MLKTILSYLVACAAFAGQVTVLSYNIQHGQGIDRKIDLERIASIVRSVKPDVVAIQEVDRDTGRSGRVDQAAELARLTGMHMIFGRTIDFDGGQYGNVVLARVPAKRSNHYPLPGHEPRGLIEVELDGYTFFATHLDATRDEPMRVREAAEINQRVSRGRGLALLAGDLNSTPESAPMKALAAEWAVAGAGRELPTIPSPKPARQIDYVLFRPADRWKVIEVRVLDEPVASDHRPILAVLEFH
jgi:endonuclease/exonuclease/phosphatase family metal-dependent hydrolase